MSDWQGLDLDQSRSNLTSRTATRAVTRAANTSKETVAGKLSLAMDQGDVQDIVARAVPDVQPEVGLVELLEGCPEAGLVT